MTRKPSIGSISTDSLNPVVNEIILDSNNIGSFKGPLASPYSYKKELREVVDGLFEAANRSTNRYFVLEGTIVRAAQSTLTGAMNYMNESRVLVQILIRGCGKRIHVIGTNDGTMPCGEKLKQLNGTVARYYCAECEDR